MLEWFRLLFDSVWDLFSVNWPGFEFPIVYAFLGCSFAVIALKIILSLFGVSLGSSISNVVKGGNNRNINVSSARKDDVK